MPSEITKAMLAAAYAQLMIESTSRSFRNEEVTRYTGISRAELALRIWNAPYG